MAHPGGAGPQYPPPHYYGPPPQYYGGVPPRPRRSRWLTIGLPVGAGVALFGALVWFLTSVLGGLTGTFGSAQENAAAYADALVDERWDDAHGLLCSESRALVTVAELAEHYDERDLTGHRIEGLNIRNHNGIESGQVTIRFTTAGGLDDVISIPLVAEDEGWRPCP